MTHAHHAAAKTRLQPSTLLLLLIGLCSIGSPDRLKSAHLHHRSPASSSRTSRHLNRSRASGSSRTSADAEIENFNSQQGRFLNLAGEAVPSPTAQPQLHLMAS